MGWIIARVCTLDQYGYGDDGVFMAMGRSILNDLTLYKDVFEIKPPGIFMVSAISWWFGDVGFIRLSQAFIIATTPLVIAVVLYLNTAQYPSQKRLITTALGGLFGFVLTTYAYANAGQFYPEFYGAWFGILYLAFLFHYDGRYNIHRIVILSYCLLFSIGFKEVFLFSTLAAALLLCRNFRSFYQGFVIPLFVAAIIGIVVMSLLGYLMPYLTIYLPYLLGDHSLMQEMAFSDTRLPLWIYGFYWSNVMSYLYRHHLTMMVFVGWAWCIAAIMSLYASKDKKARLRSVLIFLLFTYTAVLSVEIAGNTTHHQVTILPALAALFLTIVRHLQSNQSRIAQYGYGICIAILAAVVLLLPTPRFTAADVQKEQQKNALLRSNAAILDTIMDNCDIDRYLRLSIRDLPPEFAYTRHSQYSSGLYTFAFFQKTQIPLFQQMLKDSLSNTKLVLLSRTGPVTSEILVYLGKYFSPLPPACAGSVTLPDPAVLLFEKR